MLLDSKTASSPDCPPKSFNLLYVAGDGLKANVNWSPSFCGLNILPL